jgi:organic radical activating enzyme
MHRSRVAYDPRLELKRLTPADVATQVREILPKGGVVVITGGEPLLQQEGIFLLLDELWVPGGAAYSPEIETAGTIQPFGEMEYEAIQWNVSPKLEHSRNEKELRYKPDVLRWFCESGDAIFKFVVQQESDLQEVERIAQECDLPDFRIWIMPEGVTADLVLLRMRTLSAAVLDRGWNLTSRLHTLIWDDARGR